MSAGRNKNPARLPTDRSELAARTRNDAERLFRGVRLLNASLDPQQTLAGLAEIVSGIVPCDHLVVLSRRSASHGFSVAASCEILQAAQWRPAQLLRRVLEGEPVAIEDLDRALEWRTQSAELRALAVSGVFVPLIFPDGQGVLICLSRHQCHYADRQLVRLTRFGPLIVQWLQSQDTRERLEHETRARRRAVNEACANAERFRGVAASAIHAMILMDEEGRVGFWNDTAQHIFGYSRDEALGQPLHELIAPPAAREAFARESRKFRETGRGRLVDRMVRVDAMHRDGSTFPVELSISALRIDNQWHAAGIAVDVSERVAADLALRRQELMLRLFLENSGNALVALDKELRVIYYNQQYVNLFGFEDGYLAQSPRIDAVIRQLCERGIYPPEDVEQIIEQRLSELERGNPGHRIMPPLANGRVVEGYASRLIDVGYLLVFRDITEFKLQESKLLHLANHDPLTGLPNRSLLNDRIDRAIRYARRYDRKVAVLLIDLDQFKLINDNLGHAVGDRILCEVAARLLTCVRESDSVARLGGDEFVVLLSDVDSLENAARVAGLICEAVARPIVFDDTRFDLTASLGLVLCPDQGQDVDTLLRHADAAMYQAKALGRNGWRVYSSELAEGLIEKLSMRSGLRQALDRNELVLHYQPQIELSSGRLIGVEALIRWQHPEQGLIMPGRFIDVAEESGLIEPIGRWVLETACRQLKAWQDAGLNRFPVSVNVSARQFMQEDFESVVETALRHSGLEPRWLDIELTESLIMNNPEQAAVTLARLKSMGVGITGDDFGTGYSSLAYLKRFPLDRIKVDQTFVRDITRDPDDAVITRTIIEMGHNLGLDVLAEGVESIEQIHYLAELGCDELQGYYFARPLPADELRAFAGRPIDMPAMTRPGSHVLVVGATGGASTQLGDALNAEGRRVLRADDAAAAHDLLPGVELDAALILWSDDSSEAEALLAALRDLQPWCVRIVLTGRTDRASLLHLINREIVHRVFAPDSKTLLKDIDDTLKALGRQLRSAHAERALLTSVRAARSKPMSSLMPRNRKTDERDLRLQRCFDRLHTALYDARMGEVARGIYDELREHSALLDASGKLAIGPRLAEVGRMLELSDLNAAYALLALLQALLQQEPDERD